MSSTVIMSLEQGKTFVASNQGGILTTLILMGGCYYVWSKIKGKTVGPPICMNKTENHISYLTTVYKAGDILDYADEAFLVPHEGIRIMMLKMSEALNTLPAEDCPQWKIGLWFEIYDDWFYTFVHHHHSIEENTFFPWIAERATKEEIEEFSSKVDADHEDLLKTMDELKEMSASTKKGAIEKKEISCSELQTKWNQFVKEMTGHLNEEEEKVPPILRKYFTAEEVAAMEQKIIQGLGLGGNKYALPEIIHAMEDYWKGPAKAEQFRQNLPLPIRLLFDWIWKPAYETYFLGKLEVILGDKEQ